MWSVEEQVAKYIRGLGDEKLKELLERLLQELNPAQYRAAYDAVRDEGARRGLLAPRVGAGREAPR